MKLHAPVKVIRKSEVLETFGFSNSTIYNRINAGIFPPPISLGGSAKGWLQHEVNAVLAAYAAGKSTTEVQELVKELVAQRIEILDMGAAL